MEIDNSDLIIWFRIKNQKFAISHELIPDVSINKILSSGNIEFNIPSGLTALFNFQNNIEEFIKNLLDKANNNEIHSFKEYIDET